MRSSLRRRSLPLFSVLFLILFTCWAQAAQWEVAVIFLGAEESQEYHLDVDTNIKELARMQPKVRLSLLREFPNRLVEYHPDAASAQLHPWDDLFFAAPVRGVLIPGELTSESTGRAANVFESPKRLAEFFSRSFTSSSAANRLLLIYGHGEGYKGLTQASLPVLEELLRTSLPKRKGAPLDILWFNSCFMASLEAVTQLRQITDFYIASEDSEFAAGAPLDAFQFLEELSPREGAQHLAQTYIESYSFLREGVQRYSVESSAATISVVETHKLKNLTEVVPDFLAHLKQTKTQISQSTYDRRIRATEMEDPRFVDFGALAVKFDFQPIAKVLELEGPRPLKSNARFPVFAPTEGAYLVFGFDDWQKGVEGDTRVLNSLPKQLTPEKYILGPNGKMWPARRVNKRLYLTPFAVGLKKFHYFFVDEKTMRPLTSPQTIIRSQDHFFRQARSKSNPVIFSGATQKKGAASEVYTGLNVANPLYGLPSLKYLELDFAVETAWGSF